jgi:proline racemase
MAASVLRAAAERLKSDSAEAICDEELQILFAAAARCYAARFADSRLSACPAGAGISATEAMLAATGLLRAADVQLFELGLWQTFSGIRSGQ